MPTEPFCVLQATFVCDGKPSECLEKFRSMLRDLGPLLADRHADVKINYCADGLDVNDIDEM